MKCTCAVLLHGGLVCFKLEAEQPVHHILVFQNSLAVLEVAIHVEVRFLGALSARKMMGAHDCLRKNKFVLLPFFNCNAILQTFNRGKKKCIAASCRKCRGPQSNLLGDCPRIVTIFTRIQDEVFPLSLMLEYVR
jgi:hypothetical protein